MSDKPARPAPQWNPPEPRQLPFLRISMLEQLRTPQYLAEVAEALRFGLGTIQPRFGTPEDKAAVMLRDECTRLASATLWSVSVDMAALAAQAGRNLPTWKLYRHDVPSPCGLLVYDSPIAEYVNTVGETVPIVAASWGPSAFLGSDDLWVTFWSVVDHELIALTARTHTGWSMAKAREFARQYKVTDLNWDNEVVMAFDDNRIRTTEHHDEIDPATDRHLLSTTTTSWAQTLRATWLLLKPSSRKITEVEELHVPRTVARRQQRAGVTDTSTVNVVRVHSSRRPRRSADSGTQREGSKLSVRFPVSGHIRWQPYPSRDTVEPIFIETYDKGPKDAPYHVGKNYTVYRLDHPPT